MWLVRSIGRILLMIAILHSLYGTFSLENISGLPRMAIGMVLLTFIYFALEPIFRKDHP